MGMPHTTNDWTAALVEAIPNDGNRYEVIDGELFVTPAPASKHQAAVVELLPLLQAYLRATRIGYAWVSPADIRYGRHTLVCLPAYHLLRRLGLKTSPASTKMTGPERSSESRSAATRDRPPVPSRSVSRMYTSLTRRNRTGPLAGLMIAGCPDGAHAARLSATKRGL